jgi:hypothetical protein
MPPAEKKFNVPGKKKTQCFLQVLYPLPEHSKIDSARGIKPFNQDG